MRPDRRGHGDKPITEKLVKPFDQAGAFDDRVARCDHEALGAKFVEKRNHFGECADAMHDPAN
jgi:hypothetical protein